MSNLLLMDTETGGLKKTETILTLYMGSVNQNSLQIEDEIYLNIKPDDGNYVYTEDALKVNGIDLIKHDKIAITESQAIKVITDFLSKNSSNSKLIPFGHNVIFDIEFINNKLIPKYIWEKYVAENIIDTIEMVKKLKQEGKIPDALSNSLGQLAEYFFIRVSGLHDAKIDCYTTLKVYKKIKDL